MIRRYLNSDRPSFSTVALRLETDVGYGQARGIPALGHRANGRRIVGVSRKNCNLQ